MGTKLSKVPTDEAELNKLLQDIYTIAKKNYKEDKQSNFTGLLEVISSEPNIITAIHNIKGNKGSHTSGIDEKDIDDYLNMNTNDLIEEIRKHFSEYCPSKMRRVWIPKPGKEKLRPLGIPTIVDRIIQECIRNVIEPIAEAQFFIHSYGFRPMRSADMAIARVKHVQFHAKCNWVVEGDIKGFFDNMNHSIMIRSLWNIGIRDKRVLKIIKEMLKAGVMEECEVNELGTPQGGIISPLLANIYLNRFDQFITGDFENKKLRRDFSRPDGKITAMRNHSNLKTCYFVRYADDWVILTDSKESAEKLKHKAKKYLSDTLKLELSEEKTVITNVRTTPMKFLGVEVRLVKRNGRWVNHVEPERIRLKRKLESLKREIFYLRKANSKDQKRLIQNINRVNSIILGLVNYYKMCDQINVVLRVPAWSIKYTAYKSLKRYGGKWIPANMVANLIGFNSGHKANLPAIEYQGLYIGLTDLNFAKWVNPSQKNQEETPYTAEGRELYNKRMRRKGLLARVDEVNTSKHALFIRMSHNKLYTFEYYMNRPYTYRRDKGKCRICNGYVNPDEVNIHHVNPKLAKDKVNKVRNLITTHAYCHSLIHNNTEAVVDLSEKSLQNLEKFRKKLAIE